MCHRYFWGALLAATLAGPGVAQAQSFSGTGPFSSGEDGGFQAPVGNAPTLPIPTGQAGQAGFYTAFEYTMLTQTRPIGNQVIARRGFYDSSGQITGQPGTFIGSGRNALDPKNFPQRNWEPGFSMEFGYRFDDGTRLFYNLVRLFDMKYALGASFVTPGFRTSPTLADTFLTAGVFAFPNFFAGPADKVSGVPNLSVYGIWNGASQMDIGFIQRFQQMDFGARVPMFQTDYSRIYGIAGGRFAWFFERFQWRTVDLDGGGNQNPLFAADYINTMSQRMYGPMVGVGHEVFVANQFSVSCDLTSSLLLDIVKERAKYVLGDESVQSKYSHDEFRVVPNANAAINLWWYPIEGVQIRVGYQALTYFNTLYMRTPVGLNYTNIDPDYHLKFFRLVHGFNVGIGFFF